VANGNDVKYNNARAVAGYVVKASHLQLASLFDVCSDGANVSLLD